MSRNSTGFGLADGFQLAGGDLAELWWRYVAVGGGCDMAELGRRVRGQQPIDDREHDLIAQALNEMFVDLRAPSFPVAYTTTRQVPASRPAPALTAWTKGAEARRWAGMARRRSIEANRRSIELHLEAARLMQVSGQLHFARAAQQRAGQALARAARA